MINFLIILISWFMRSYRSVKFYRYACNEIIHDYCSYIYIFIHHRDGNTVYITTT